MKSIALFALATIGLCASSMVVAQTCSAPTTISSNSSFSGNTCAATGNESGVATVCGNGNFTDKAAVFTWVKGDVNSAHTGAIVLTPTGTTPSYDIGAAVIRTTCASTGVCVGLTDSNQDGTSGESVDLTATGFGPAGTYFLFVTSFGDGTTGATCGPFNGQAGILPVKLQTFNID
ncbi:MAG: hypothetical protein ABJB01_01075 [Rudaea sp.]